MPTYAIIGGGIIGLATARALSMRLGLQSQIIVLEAQGYVGLDTTARNSGVIHGGMYYGTNTTKAKMCVKGRKMLYEYMEKRNIRHRKCGKLIVSTNENLIQLQKILLQAQQNGLDDSECRLISKEEANAREPNVLCEKALLCEQTGIVDVQHLLQMLEADLDEYGVDVVKHCEVDNVSFMPNPEFSSSSSQTDYRFLLETNQGVLGADYVVNCGGLRALQLANTMHRNQYQHEHEYKYNRIQSNSNPNDFDSYSYSADLLPQKMYFAKGSYFRLPSNLNPFQGLVYPLPNEAGLGVHSTIDMADQIRFGPDVEWLKNPQGDSFAWKPEDCTHENLNKHYVLDENRCHSFYEEIRKYYPSLPDNCLLPDYAGIRPKLVGPGKSAHDFVVHGPEMHRTPGLVHCLGIESPGLTSSLAIADMIATLTEIDGGC
jgi:L-2-hydroxyglutarate oxidase LhgO